ncbi:MAG: hypothetical protein LBM23_06380 [Propionibacteriaceae bacterium]|jgi:molybdopterin molybdotransferase|nr:hypothetical protein [Propionibacteriaceae bacterium]
MALFHRNREVPVTEQPASPDSPTLPQAPPEAVNGLRAFMAHRDWVTSMIEALPSLGVSLLDAVGLTLNESILSEVDLPSSGIHVGDVLVAKRMPVTPRLAGLLAGVGIDKVLVRPRPRIIVIAVTQPGDGDHVVWGARTAQVVLATALQDFGAQVWPVSAEVADDEHLTQVVSDQVIRADLIITVGGIGAPRAASAQPQGDGVETEASAPVSVERAIRGMGVSDFTPIALSPGRHQGFALLKEDDHRVPLVALPGDPITAHVLFEILLKPIVRKLMGMVITTDPVRTGRLMQAVNVTPQVMTCVNGTINDLGMIHIQGRPSGPEGLVTISRSNALVLLESESGRIDQSAEVNYLSL